jgi:hypothetical protein
MAFATRVLGTRVSYYTCPPRQIAPGVRLFDFVLPLLAGDTAVGGEPAALALGMVQSRRFEQDGGGQRPVDVCRLHFLLAGEAAVRAAAETRTPLRVLSFINLDESLGGEAYALEAASAGHGDLAPADRTNPAW